MKKLIATALIAFSALSGIAATANADYFGTSRQTQEGQNLPGIFGQIEKGSLQNQSSPLHCAARSTA